MFSVTSEFPVWISPGFGALFFILKYFEKYYYVAVKTALTLQIIDKIEHLILMFYQMVILVRNETSHVFKSFRCIKTSGSRDSPTA